MRTTSSVPERGNTESKTHSVVILKIGSYYVKFTVSRMETLWVYKR